MATPLTFTRRRALELGGSALAVAALAGSSAAPALAQNATVPLDALLKEGPVADIWLGEKSAPITIVEYASTTCSHCAAFHAGTFKELKSKYIETGKVRFVLREFPLNPVDMAAYMLARCSGDDKRYAVVDLLFSQQKAWVTDKPLVGLSALLKQTGMSQSSFESCLKDKAMYDKIGEARDLASEKFGVNSTPTFFVNGQRLVGDVSLAEMEKVMLPLIKG
ncbi:MAG: oxidoreductase [Hyphomicrobiales bacterium]|nr:oxidoreductase [Hyphomicrobiales bacterium]